MTKIVQMVRGNLSMMETLTLGALIVLEVHNKDVVKILIDDQVNDFTAFEWLAQLRYYWIADQIQV
jgi:dynein heavy chain